MEKGPSFIKGLLVILGVYLFAIPAAVIPLVGPVLAITLVPYLSSALGARYANPKERLPLAITCSIIWSSVFSLAALLVMNKLASLSPMGFTMDGFAWTLILTFWIFNTVFTVLGAMFPWRNPFSESQ